MNSDKLKDIGYEDQKSLAILNISISFILFVVVYGFYHSCSHCQESFKKRVDSFIQGKEIKCKNRLISKKRGWSLDKKKRLFIKGDSFIDIRVCEGGC